MRNGQPQKPRRRVRAPEVIDERRDGERHQLIGRPRGRRQRRHRPDRRRKRHARRDSRIHRQAVADRVQVGIHAILRKINRMHGVCRRVARQGNPVPDHRVQRKRARRRQRRRQHRGRRLDADIPRHRAAHHPPARHAASQFIHLTGCVRNGCAEREQQHEAAEENTADG